MTGNSSYNSLDGRGERSHGLLNLPLRIMEAAH